MGVFLAAPLLERLNQCAPGSGLDAQLILEILVPLVYRPAIKVQPLLYGSMATFITQKLCSPVILDCLILLKNRNADIQSPVQVRIVGHKLSRRK